MQHPVKSEHIRSIPWDLIWTLLTCYLYTLHVQHRQILAVNDMLKQNKYDFWHWLLFTLLTCGLYHIYHEYRKSTDIVAVMGTPNSYEPLLSVLLTCFSLHMVADAVQQVQINKFYGSDKL